MCHRGRSWTGWANHRLLLQFLAFKVDKTTTYTPPTVVNNNTQVPKANQSKPNQTKPQYLLYLLMVVVFRSYGYGCKCSGREGQCFGGYAQTGLVWVRYLSSPCFCIKPISWQFGWWVCVWCVKPSNVMWQFNSIARVYVSSLFVFRLHHIKESKNLYVINLISAQDLMMEGIFGGILLQCLDLILCSQRFLPRGEWRVWVQIP